MANAVVPFRASAQRNVSGTHVEAGQLAFAIYNDAAKKYFIWAYTNQKYAEKIALRVEPADETDVACNWRRSLHQLTITDRKKD